MLNTVIRSFSFLIIAVAFSCGTADQESVPLAEEMIIRDSVVCTSLLGTPLKHVPETASSFHHKDSLLQIARSNYEADPSKLENIIWYGRRLAYLTDYRKAMEVYTHGLHIHPESPHIYRHRGHRYISMRRFEEAQADLALASVLARGMPVEIEPDGIPNSLNQPLSNLHFNIWYHLGLAHYLQGNYTDAANAYDTCMTFSDNPDLLIATTYWSYLTARRMGDEEKATALLDPIRSNMKIVENDAYLQLLLLYKNEKQPNELLTEDEISASDQLDVSTRGYGVANYHLHEGNKAEAERIMQRVLLSPMWPAFGYIAAEADLARGVNNL